jgi:transcriptional regulator with GAF, ATPase, and Fis domain
MCSERRVMTEQGPNSGVISLIDRLSSRLISAAVSPVFDAIEPAITDALRQVGEAAAADYAILESVCDDSAHVRSRQAWVRPGAIVETEPAVSIRVPATSGCTFTLSVGMQDWGSSWPTELTDGLRSLAHVMALIVDRDQQRRELEHIKNEMTERAPKAPLQFNPCDPDEFENVIGSSPALGIAMARVQEVAPTDASVVILGETGTGKELIARAVHNRSRRRGRPFVRVNCAALPSTLIETELFGHVRGAFTGAVTTRQGRFEVADSGTLFLDEIGDLPADVQAKLLRVLQEGEFERVGSSQTRRVDVRIVAATNQDLDRAMKEGRFRADLYYRLSVFPIVLPPLRERTEDIPRLTWYFVNRRQRALNRRFTTIPASVFAELQRRSWPGNVRELQNVIERAMIHSTGDTLLLDDVPDLSLAPRGEDHSGTLADIERRCVEDALQRCRWRINGRGNAADVLGLHPNTLRNRMKKFGIHRPSSPTPIELGRRNVGAVIAS